MHFSSSQRILTKIYYILARKAILNKFKGIKIMCMILSGPYKIKLENNEYIKINKNIYWYTQEF